MWGEQYIVRLSPGDDYGLYIVGYQRRHEDGTYTKLAARGTADELQAWIDDHEIVVKLNDILVLPKGWDEDG